MQNDDTFAHRSVKENPRDTLYVLRSARGENMRTKRACAVRQGLLERVDKIIKEVHGSDPERMLKLLIGARFKIKQHRFMVVTLS